jgi:hypothetical protein
LGGWCGWRAGHGREESTDFYPRQGIFSGRPAGRVSLEFPGFDPNRTFTRPLRRNRLSRLLRYQAHSDPV